MIVHFGPSARISTYLTAFSFGDFQVGETKTSDGTPVRASAIREMSSDPHRLATVAAGCVEGVQKLVNVKYGFNKLDNIQMRTMGGAGKLSMHTVNS